MLGEATTRRRHPGPDRRNAAFKSRTHPLGAVAADVRDATKVRLHAHHDIAPSRKAIQILREERRDPLASITD